MKVNLWPRDNRPICDRIGHDFRGFAIGGNQGTAVIWCRTCGKTVPL